MKVSVFLLFGLLLPTAAIRGGRYRVQTARNDKKVDAASQAWLRSAKGDSHVARSLPYYGDDDEDDDDRGKGKGKGGSKSSDKEDDYDYGDGDEDYYDYDTNDADLVEGSDMLDDPDGTPVQSEEDDTSANDGSSGSDNDGSTTGSGSDGGSSSGASDSSNNGGTTDSGSNGDSDGSSNGTSGSSNNGNTIGSGSDGGSDSSGGGNTDSGSNNGGTTGSGPNSGSESSGGDNTGSGSNSGTTGSGSSGGDTTGSGSDGSGGNSGGASDSSNNGGTTGSDSSGGSGNSGGTSDSGNKGGTNDTGSNSGSDSSGSASDSSNNGGSDSNGSSGSSSGTSDSSNNGGTTGSDSNGSSGNSGGTSDSGNNGGTNDTGSNSGSDSSGGLSGSGNDNDTTGSGSNGGTDSSGSGTSGSGNDGGTTGTGSNGGSNNSGGTSGSGGTADETSNNTDGSSSGTTDTDSSNGNDGDTGNTAGTDVQDGEDSTGTGDSTADTSASGADSTVVAINDREAQCAETTPLWTNTDFDDVKDQEIPYYYAITIADFSNLNATIEAIEAKILSVIIDNVMDCSFDYTYGSPPSRRRLGANALAISSDPPDRPQLDVVSCEAGSSCSVKIDGGVTVTTDGPSGFFELYCKIVNAIELVINTPDTSIAGLEAMESLPWENPEERPQCPEPAGVQDTNVKSVGASGNKVSAGLVIGASFAGMGVVLIALLAVRHRMSRRSERKDETTTVADSVNKTVNSHGHGLSLETPDDEDDAQTIAHVTPTASYSTHCSETLGIAASPDDCTEWGPNGKVKGGDIEVAGADADDEVSSVESSGNNYVPFLSTETERTRTSFEESEGSVDPPSSRSIEEAMMPKFEPMLRDESLLHEHDDDELLLQHSNPDPLAIGEGHNMYRGQDLRDVTIIEEPMEDPTTIPEEPNMDDGEDMQDSLIVPKHPIDREQDSRSVSFAPDPEQVLMHIEEEDMAENATITPERVYDTERSIRSVSFADDHMIDNDDDIATVAPTNLDEHEYDMQNKSIPSDQMFDPEHGSPISHYDSSGAQDIAEMETPKV